MRIEEITASKLKEAPDRELYSLRLRFVQLYNKNFKGNRNTRVGTLTRSDFLKKYKLLMNEMKNRGLSTSKVTDIDVEVFRKAMFGGLDVSTLGDIVIVENYLSIAGSFVKSPTEANDIDIIVRDSSSNRDEGLELKVGRLIEKETEKLPHFVYSPRGPHSSYIPLFDLVLRSKEETKRVKVRESKKVEKQSELKLTLIGTGALDSPRKDECLLVEYQGQRILIDAGPDIQPKDVGELTDILVCDPESDFMKDARRLGEKYGIEPGVKSISEDGLKITPFKVKHTSHDTYGYKIEADNKTIIYAPEFFEFPTRQVKNADIAILEGSAWSKPIVFTGKTGGHAAVLDSWEKAKEANVDRIIFTHIGKTTEAHLKDAEEMGIEIGHDGQVIIPKAKVKKKAITLGRPFTPLKSRGGYGTYEFADIEALWTTWAQGYIPEPGVAVEVKYDGFRVQVHKKDDTVRIFSEDAKRDLSPRLEDVVKEIKTIKQNCILDGELLIYVNNKKVERRDMPSYLMAKEPEEFKAEIEVFDCLYFDDRALNELPWEERQKYLDKIFSGVDELLLHRVKPIIAKTKDRFFAAVKKCSSVEHSEGAMLKVVNSKYPLDGKTSEWAKFKNFKELRVKIIDKETKKGGGYIYTCALRNNIPIGRTYATKIDAKVGDVLEVAVAEVLYNEEEDRFSWDNPIVRSKKPAGTALTTKEQAKALAKLRRTKAMYICECLQCGYSIESDEHCREIKCPKCGGEMRRLERPGPGYVEKEEIGNISFKEGDSGTGVAQIHIMGLGEGEVDKLREESNRLMMARADIGKLRTTLLQSIGNHGAHIDIRLRRDKENSWQGCEIFIGNIEGLLKLKELQTGKKKLRAPWKQSRAGEPETEVVRGPLGWMEAGARKVEFFKPGTPGATANKWGAIIRIDTFNWLLYYSEEHAKKFHITDSRFFEGNWLFAFVPVGEKERVWMMSKLKDDDHEKEQSKEPAEKSMMFKIYKLNKRKHLVGGVVYEPETVDAQGDYTDAEEIEKAIERFMEKYAKDPKRIRVNHQGRAYYFPIIECFQPETDIKKGGKTVKAGSWWLMVKVTDDSIWQLVESGKLTGFSMGGRASEAKEP